MAKDPVEAVCWYRLASEQGHASANSNLAYLFQASPWLEALLKAVEDAEKTQIEQAAKQPNLSLAVVAAGVWAIGSS